MIELEFSEDGIDTIAKIASEVNSTVENIGARRLHTIIEKYLMILVLLQQIGLVKK